MILPVTVLWGFGPACGQDYLADTWQTDRGLPHPTVTAIQQTKDGYLWLGTQNGLARFDGVRFTTFRSIDTPGLRSDRVLCLRETRDGALWIGTTDGGLSLYQQGRFTALTTVDGLSSDTVLCLGEDRSGGLWAGTASGLNSRVSGRLTSYFKTDGLPDDTVLALCQPRRSAMLALTGKGLCQLSRDGLAAAGLPAEASQSGDPACLIEDRKGQLWLGGVSGLLRMTGIGGKGGSNNVTRMASLRVRSIVERAPGEIWYGTEAGELWRVTLEGGADQATLAWHTEGPILALCEDSEANLWIGTAGQGLHRLKRRQLHLASTGPIGEDSTPPHFFETPEGELRWLAANGELYRCEAGGGRLLERLPLPEGVVVQTATAASGDRLWMGTARDGLLEWTGNTLQQLGERAGLSDSSITALLSEEDGAVWIGTRNGGLNRLEKGVVTRYNTPWGFLGNYASVMVKDQVGSLWIGTTGDGLFRLAEGRFTRFTEADGLASREIRTLYADQGGSLWVGTARGLCRVRAGRVTSFSGRRGLTDEAVLQLRGDTDDGLWLGANSGILRVRREQLEAWADRRTDLLDATPFGSEDGLPGLQCLPKAHGRSGAGGHGGLWFATTKGLVRAERKGWQWNAVAPQVTLEQVRVDNESVPLEDPIRVPPGKESLQFQFTATSLTAPGKVRFRCQLEGFDHTWSEPGTLRFVRYARVPPGKYRFRVLGCNNDGVWSEAGASVGVTIEPFWWNTVWFRLAMAGAAAGLLAGFYRLRESRRAEIEHLRVRIASDLHDDIGSSLWSITLLSRMLAKHGHLDTEARQDVEDIHRISIQTANAIRDIIWLVNPAFDSVQDLALRTKDFAGTVLRGVEYRVRCEGIDPARRLSLDLRQNVFLLFKEALTNVARHAQATVVEVAIEQRGHQWQFSVQDNGRGFDPGGETSGNGLKNLRARARKMGAELNVQTAPGRGTTIMLTILRPTRLPKETPTPPPASPQRTMTP